jgi:hypothetical protein
MSTTSQSKEQEILECTTVDKLGKVLTDFKMKIIEDKELVVRMVDAFKRSVPNTTMGEFFQENLLNKDSLYTKALLVEDTNSMRLGILVKENCVSNIHAFAFKAHPVGQLYKKIMKGLNDA